MFADGFQVDLIVGKTVIYVTSLIFVQSCHHLYAFASPSESLLEARASHTDCIRGEKSAISTALTSVIGYADPPGDGPPHQITSMTLSIYLFDPRRVFILNTTKVNVTFVRR